MQPQHDLGGQFDEIYLQDLGHEGEAPGCTQVAFYDLDRILLREELDVERTGYPEGSGNGACDLLDPPDSLDVKLLRRELDGGVT